MLLTGTSFDLKGHKIIVTLYIYIYMYIYINNGLNYYDYLIKRYTNI